MNIIIKSFTNGEKGPRRNGNFIATILNNKCYNNYSPLIKQHKTKIWAPQFFSYKIGTISYRQLFPILSIHS